MDKKMQNGKEIQFMDNVHMSEIWDSLRSLNLLE